MRISQNLKNKLAALREKHNYTHVSSICSNHYYTDYFHYVSIDDIMQAENGENMSYGRYNGKTATMFYNENPNCSAIQYSNIFNA